MKNDLLNRKTKISTSEDNLPNIKKDKKADSNERSCCFETTEGKGKIIKIKDFQSFVKEVSKIKNPCALGNIENILNSEKKLKDGEIIDINLDSVDKNDIIQLTSKIDMKNFFNDKKLNKFPLIFSSIIKTEKEQIIQNDFTMIHQFDNKMSEKCEINKFLPNKQGNHKENANFLLS